MGKYLYSSVKYTLDLISAEYNINKLTHDQNSSSQRNKKWLILKDMNPSSSIYLSQLNSPLQMI